MTESPQTIAAPPLTGPRSRGLSAAVRAVGLARLDAPTLAAFRKKPGPIPEGWSPIAPAFLKTSDDQTVAAVAAVLGAIAGQGGDLDPSAYAAWGVVAASRYLGRSQLVVALQRFADEGVWGVSPHLIPHYALHSPAGTLSLALGAHGPNLGVGGGPGSVMEGALTAMTWLAEGRLPGAWLVLSGHDPELVPDATGRPSSPTECCALALALTADGGTASGLARLRLVADGCRGPSGPVELGDLHARLASTLDVGVAGVGLPTPVRGVSTGVTRTLPLPPGVPSTIATDPASGLRLEWLAGDINDTEGWR